MKTWFTDVWPIAGTRRTNDGYLVADVLVARTGMQTYRGYELGMPERENVTVYRDEAAVFSKKSLASYAHKPVTDDHPAGDVTAQNWKKLSVGQVGGEIIRDGDSVKIPLIVMDADMIAKVESGKRELSAGYDAEIDFTPGKTRDGEAYDARLEQIRVNHVAIVQRGRAGAAYRIGDAESGGRSKWGALPRNTNNGGAKVRVLIDSVPFDLDEAAAAAVGKLQDSLTALNAKLTSSTSEHATIVAAKDMRIGELTVELQKAKDALPNEADLDKRVAQRSALIADARKIHKDLVTDGKSDAAIRKEAVAKKFGDASIADASDEMIAGMFRAATRDAVETDPIRDALRKPGVVHDNATDNGQAAYEARLRDAWKAA